MMPKATFYKPSGIPTSSLDIISLALDELEAIRLVDGEGLDQTQAAERMNVSRATVGRILERGRNKIATALTRGAALQIDQGAAPVTMACRPGRGRGKGMGRGRRHRGLNSCELNEIETKENESCE
jgi:predicted DNA-binding protein (UPF0251 family)